LKATEALAPVHIGKVVRNAQVFNFRNPRGRTVSDDGIFAAVARLFALLTERRVDYLLVGGIAVLQYVEGRNTEDIDLVVPPSALREVPEIRITGEDGDFRRGSFDGLRIDLLLTSHPLFAHVRQRYATTRQFVEREIPCATVEGLLILKLYALPSLYRQGDLVRVALYETDVLALLDRYRPPTEPLFEELRPHLTATDLAAVRQIVAEIQQKIERFDRGPGRAGSA
jgi:hypothetical protein